MALLRSSRSLATFVRGTCSRSPYLIHHYASSGRAISNFSESTAWALLNKMITEPQRRESLMLKTTPIMIKYRGFAKAAAPPPQLHRQVAIKLYRESAGIVVDPYKPYTRLPLLKRWFTKEGWKQKKERILHELRTAYTVAKLRQKSGYTRRKFYSLASALYTKINTAIADGDRTVLRQLVTENMFSILKKEFKQREGVWARISWETVSPIKIQTLQGRLAAVDPKKVDNAFVQLTLMIRSNQKFAAFDKQGKVVAGDPDKKILVEDIWVFESILGHPDKTWRLCARITP